MWRGVSVSKPYLHPSWHLSLPTLSSFALPPTNVYKVPLHGGGEGADRAVRGSSGGGLDDQAVGFYTEMQLWAGCLLHKALDKTHKQVDCIK